MRPTYHYTLLLVALVIALTVSGRTSAAPVPQPSRPGSSVAPAAESADIRFELQCRRSGDLVATIHNAGTADTAMIFGSVLGNGAKYVVAHHDVFMIAAGRSRVLDTCLYGGICAKRADLEDGNPVSSLLPTPGTSSNLTLSAIHLRSRLAISGAA